MVFQQRLLGKIYRERILVFSISFFLLGIGSCSEESIQLSCQDEFPLFKEEVSLALVEVQSFQKPLSQSRADRAIASQPKKRGATPQLTEEKKEYWLDWSKDRLGDIQKYLDQSDIDASLRPITRKLTLAANQIVQFHSHVESGHTKEMARTLKLVDTYIEDVRRSVCRTP